ncbi:MAG: hypothetical protein WEF50_04305 [Myxococcota bacterium]
MEPDDEDRDEDEDYASPAELRQGIEMLGVGDTKKLMFIAGVWWRHFELRGRSGAPDDLLQEAIELSLSDRRRWPKKRITLVKFLDGVMKSIASHEVEAAVSEEARIVRALPAADAEGQVAAREQLEEIEALLQGDTRSQEALRCRAQGMDAGEIREALQMDTREWERVKKQILRAVVKFKKRNGE